MEELAGHNSRDCVGKRLNDERLDAGNHVTLKVAVAQFTVKREPEQNLTIIDNYARAAAAGGARLLVMPEGLIARDGDDDGFAAAHAQPLNGPFAKGLKRISAEQGVTLMGTIHVAAPRGPASATPETPFELTTTSDNRVSNAFLVVREGDIIADYRKLHLYDAFAAKESDVVSPGTQLPPIVDIDGWKIGVMTCYDVRFPEVARSLAVRGADVIVVSAAWVRGDCKKRHWKLLTAARAVENTCYVLACSEVSKRNIGCSRIIDPMGETVAEADDTQSGLINAVLDRNRLERVREALPVLKNRRFADPQLKRGCS